MRFDAPSAQESAAADPAYGRKKRDFRLILAGLRGFHAETIERLIEEMGLRDSVQITGWVPREELYSLYERARAFVYPSMFEGFGMPVLEALAAGFQSRARTSRRCAKWPATPRCSSIRWMKTTSHRESNG